ncbi:MAG: CDF family Co(II)/Ni(II) efflux transporter DmeF [Spirochaetia bacterium]|jgi:cation diffusion facilitator family transporter
MRQPPDIAQWQHSHDFSSDSHPAEKRTWTVVAITAAMMVVELVSGYLFNSMAVVADGWHMSTHAAALGLAGIAFALSRRAAKDSRFAFGPWKIEALGGYTSALILLGVAVFMAWQSVQRIFQPLQIQYGQALIVAAVGLVVNVVCALILGGHGHGTHHHVHDHPHEHASHSHHECVDVNSKAAYMHVVADALTSVLAIIALLAGRFLHFGQLDPLMGIVGGVLITVWAVGLIRESGRVLLDREMDHEIVSRVRTAVEGDGDSKISDLHVWRIGKAHFACEVAIVGTRGLGAAQYRERLHALQEIAHVTIEVNRLL